MIDGLPPRVEITFKTRTFAGPEHSDQRRIFEE